MTTERLCPECRQPLDAGELTGGLCRSCLMRGALGDLDSAEPETLRHDTVGALLVDPESIGPYRVIRRLGEGGMGVVFHARQNEPIEREVALKVVRSGLGSRRILARFQLERQSLARMDHPGIARIYDAGATGTGQPYFVMEYVDGSPITRFCDERRLTTAQRLRLFQQVCTAVQHAHHKGVIHRDLKPGNILVRDGEDGPEPRVIDFGIAKTVDGDRGTGGALTELGKLVGTPAYMSPEQAGAVDSDVDTRTDVYSLGVVLYELLVGRPPHDPRQLARADMEQLLQTVRRAPVSVPSARLSAAPRDADETARKRSTDPATLTRELKGDLDWITLRAVEKDRDRRYGTPSELSRDIGRYLNDEPVNAGPPSTTYRLRKFVRRNRLAVAAGAMIVLGMLAAITGVSVGMVRARRAEREARLQATIAEATNRFLNEDLLGSVAPEISGRDVKVRDVLDRASELIDARFAEDVPTRAAIHSTVGQAYQSLGELEAARSHAERALALRRAELGDRDPATAVALADYGSMVAEQGDLPGGERILAEAFETLRDVAGPDDERTLKCQRTLAAVLVWQTRFDEAYELFADALPRARRSLGNDHLETITLLNDYGLFCSRAGRLEQAEQLLQAAVAGYTALRGERSGDTLVAASNLATFYVVRGDYVEALPRFEKLREDYREVFGEDHPRTLSATNNLATVYRRAGRVERAIPLFEEVARRREELFGYEHRSTLTSLNNLGWAYLEQHRLADARDVLERAADGRRTVLGPEHPHTLATLATLARCYGELDLFDDAFAILEREVLARREILAQKDPGLLGVVLSGYGALLARAGRHPDAEAALLEAREVFDGTTSAKPSDDRHNLELLIELYETTGRPLEAASWGERLARAEP